MEEIAIQLAHVWDNIDTAGDMAKGDEKFYKKLIRRELSRSEDSGLTLDDVGVEAMANLGVGQ